MRMTQSIAAAIAGLLLAAVCFGGVPAGKDLTPELAIDQDALTRARTRGEAMLKEAKWQTPLPIADLAGGSAAVVRMFDAGDAIIWWPSQYASSVIADKSTGKARQTSLPLPALARGGNGGQIAITRLMPPRGATSQLALVDVLDGKQHWQTDAAPFSDSALIAGKQIFTGPSVPGATPGPRIGRGDPLIVRSTDRTLEMWAHDRATGEKQWSYTLPAGTLTAMPFACGEGVVYALSQVGADGFGARPSQTLLGIDAADGKQIFAVPAADVSPMVLNGNELVALNATGELVGFDGRTGKEKWREKISLSKEPGKVVLRISEHSYQDEAPVLVGDKILVRVFGRTTPSSIDPTSQNEDNYMTGVAAFDAKSHKQLWFFRPPDDTNDRGGGRLARQLQLIGIQAEKDHIVALAFGGELAYIGINLKDGTLEWYLPTSSENKNGLVVKSEPVISNGVVYIVKDSKLIALPLAARGD